MLKSGIYDFVICRGGTDMCFVLEFGRKRSDLKQYLISGLTPTIICSPNTLFFCLRGTTSETLNPGPSFTFIAFVVNFTFFAPPTTLLLLCGVGDWGSLKGYTRQHTVATYILSSAFSGVVELTTQLLRLISILWLPLCRINKLGYSYPRRLLRSPTLVGYQDYFLAPFLGSIALLISSLDK